ncbi:MAG: hypothetical protein EPN93_07305 [Spirochaetes bacterium]|nr:MAG: hypothetical protein EPN93_07305 [Spirochaetota bacterium]
MKSLTVIFEKFEDYDFRDILYGLGVYVIWDSKSKAKPTYIGEGDIWNRFTQHRNRFAEPIDGYIALLEGTTNVVKKQSQIIEAALLEVAKTIDLFPNHNKKNGNWNHIDKVFDKHGVLKIYFEGMNPFKNPASHNTPMKNRKEVRITYNNTDNILEYDHNWNS